MTYPFFILIKKSNKRLGEDVDDFIVQTSSKTQQIIKDYTAVASNAYQGVDVLDANGNLRNTYDILLDIAKVYKEIQEEDKKAGTNRAQALVETLAGKNRSNIASSILLNPELLENVYNSALDSEGSALEENEKYLDSISGKLQQIQNLAHQIVFDFVDSETLKWLLNVGKSLLEIVDQLVKANAIIPSIVGLLTGGSIVKGLKTGEGVFQSIITALMSFDSSKPSSFLSTFFSDWKGLNEILGKSDLAENLGEAFGDAISSSEATEGLAEKAAETIEESVSDAVDSVKENLSDKFNDALSSWLTPEDVDVDKLTEATEGLAGANTTLEASNKAVTASEVEKAAAQQQSTITSGEETLATEAETKSEEKNVLANQSDAYSEMMEVQAELASAASSGTEAGATITETGVEIANASANFAKATSKFSSATAKLVTTFAYGASQGEGFIAVLKGLKAVIGLINPAVAYLGLTIAATGVAAYAAYRYFYHYRIALDEAKKSAEEANKALSDVEGKLSDVQSQIEAIKSDGVITITEQADLDRLEQQNKALEVQLKYRKLIADQENQKVVDAARDTWNDEFGSTNSEADFIMQGQMLTGALGMPGAGFAYVNADTTQKTQTDRVSEAYEQALKAHEDASKALEDAQKAAELDGEITEEERKQIDELTKTEQKRSKALQDENTKRVKQLAAIQEQIDLLGLTEEGRNSTEYQEALEQQRQLVKINPEDVAQWNEDEIKSIIEDLGLTDEELTELAEIGVVSTNSVKGLTEALGDADLILENGLNPLDLFNQYLKKFKQENDISTQSVKELHDALYKSGNWDDIYVKLNVDLESDAFKQSVANWKEQNAHLLDGITDVDEYNKALEVFNRTAENAVAASIAFNSGFEDLNSNLESYKETLNKANEEGYEFVESSSDYADTVAQLAADLSGLTGYEFSNNEVLEFLNQSDNFDTLTNAINGSEDALRQLQNSAREYSNLQVDIKAILDTDSFDFDYQSFFEWFNSDEVQNAGQLTFTAGLDSSVFIEQLNQALKDGKITAEQIRGLFNSLGWDVDFEYEEIEVPHLVTDKNAYGGGGGGKPQVTIQQGTDTIKVPKNIRYINKDQSTKAANTPQGFNSSQKDKINSKSDSGGGGGSDKEETPETYDWIETRISRLERDIQNFDKVVNASYKNWGERLGAIPKEYDKVLQEIETQNAGYARYMQEASKVGLPEEYAQKVRDGLIDIESITDETLKQGINDYKQWYEKAIQCADAVEDLRAKLAELAKLKFDNIATIFDSVLESVSHLNSLISTAMDTVETQGYLVSKAYYERMTEYESYNLSKLNQEYEELKKARQEALDSGAIEENSQDWWDMQHSIEGVESAIYDAKKALAEYADAMRQIEWDLFDRTQGYISQIIDESDWIQALLRTEHTITNDETGRLNEYGKSIGGLTAVDYNVYMRQSQMYADEIEKINKELANDPYNAKLIDRRNELLNLQRQSIQAAEDEKEAIRSLIKESYDEMLRILQELIDKRKEALQAEKDLYDYQKNIQSQADNINSLRKQILALSGDESEENQARLQSLRTELSTAESDLEDTEYDKWLSDQNEAMDNMYQSAEDFLNERLKNIDLLVTEVIATTNDNAELISDTINTEVAEAGYNLTTEMENIWDGQQKIVSDFQGTFVDGVGQVIDTQYVSTVAVCDSIAAYTVAMMNNSTAIANGILNNINQNSSQIFNNINATINAINQGTSSITSYLNSILSACNNIAAKVGTGGGSAGGGGGTNTSTTTSYNTPNTIPNTAWTDSRHYSNSSGYVVGGKTTFVHHETGGYAWKETRKIAYAEGGTIGKALRKSGEDGIILAKTGEEVLSLEKIAGMKDVLNAFEPLALAIHKMPNVGTSINNGSTNNEINVSFEFPNVNNYEQFIQTARTDTRFERIIQQMTIGNALGGNTLKKYTL